MSNTTNKVRPFGMRDKIGYMFGDFGNDFTFILSSTFLMKFYTDVMGVSAGIVGLMMMVARIVDAFTDVTMGQIADRSRPTAKGKFLPWIRRMCGPVALASFLMYAVWFKDMPMDSRSYGCLPPICYGEVSAIQVSTFLMVPWLPLFLLRQETVLNCPAGELSAQHWQV